MNAEFGRTPEPGYDFEAFLPSPSFTKLVSIHDQLGHPYSFIVAQQTDFLNWSSTFHARGYDIRAISPDAAEVVSFSSAFFDAARFGGVRSDWQDSYMKYKQDAGDDKPCMTVDVMPRMTSFLTRIERRVGLDAVPVSHDAVINIGAFHIEPVFELTNDGFFIVAYRKIDNEGFYIPWESEYNRRYGDFAENAIVDASSLVQSENRDIQLPFHFAD